MDLSLSVASVIYFVAGCYVTADVRLWFIEFRGALSGGKEMEIKKRIARGEFLLFVPEQRKRGISDPVVLLISLCVMIFTPGSLLPAACKFGSSPFYQGVRDNGERKGYGTSG